MYLNLSQNTLQHLQVQLRTQLLQPAYEETPHSRHLKN